MRVESTVVQGPKESEQHWDTLYWSYTRSVAEATVRANLHVAVAG